MTDHALPDDLIEIIAEAEKLVADAVDADAKQAAAKLAIQNAVQGIVDAAQVSVSKLYAYLKPGSPSPILAIMWPTADAPVAEPVAAEPVAADLPVGEPEVVEAPALEPVAIAVEPVGGEVAPQEPAFPVDAAEPIAQVDVDPVAVVDTATASTDEPADAGTNPGDTIQNG